MTPHRGVFTICLITCLTGAVVAESSAQPLGPFRWQEQPYCNVLTLSVTPSAGVFLLEGYDDECGDSRRSSAVGVAFLNPDGSVGIGLTVVSAGGSPIHLDAMVSLASLNGTWRDNAGQSGAWTFTAAAGTGGARRPAPRTLFPSGLSAAGATIADVGAPVNPGDAAPKGYVDAASATTLAGARSLATASIPLTAYSATAVGGELLHSSGGCMRIARTDFGIMWLDLPAPTGAVIQALRLKYIDNSPEALRFDVVAANFIEGAPFPSDTVVRSLNSSNASGALHMELVTFDALPPVTSTRNYYFSVLSPVHSESLEFCGAEVIYSIP